MTRCSASEEAADMRCAELIFGLVCGNLQSFVAAGAVIILLPMLRSFARGGIRPQRMSRNCLSPVTTSTVATGWVGGLLKAYNREAA